MTSRLKHTIIFIVLVFLIFNPLSDFYNLDIIDLLIFIYLCFLFSFILYEKIISVVFFLPILSIYFFGAFLFPTNIPIYVFTILIILTLLFSVSISTIIKIFEISSTYSYREYVSFYREEIFFNKNRKKKIPVEANIGVSVGSLALQKALHLTLPGLGFIANKVITSLFGELEPTKYDDRLNIELRKFIEIITFYESILFRMNILLFLVIPLGIIILNHFTDYFNIEPYLINSQLKNILTELWKTI